MTAQVEKEDWNDLIELLKQAESSVSLEGSSDNFKASRQALQAFHTTSAMLGLPELERAGLELEKYVTQQIESSPSAEEVAVFGFAVNALLEEMGHAGLEDKSPAVQVMEVLEILGAVTPEESTEPKEAAFTLEEKGVLQEAPAQGTNGEPVPGVAQAPLDYASLERMIIQLGGRLTVGGSNGDVGTFTLSFQATPEILGQVETLLSAGDPHSPFAPRLTAQDNRTEKIVQSIKDFMLALSKSDLGRAQDILLNLAEQQHQAELYNEIGGLARELHNSLKGFMDTMDPALKEMVEEKLPDSGNRLEHILELTETAANTTIDHVETMQKRNGQEQKQIERMQEHLKRLCALGDKAQKRLGDCGAVLEELRTATLKNHDDLIVVLTAQDYQDLTGQIILKIIQLLKDLEMRLVNVIRTFGLKMEPGKSAASDQLYGPAHKAKKEALHSQDDVDSLLAEFGF